MTERPGLNPQQTSGRNWPILLGGVLSLLVLAMAFFGPLLAPKDPLKESYIAQFGDRFLPPPFPPGVEGYPLGSDEFGRDVLSRLLWAVRPTLTLVLVVAALRLSIGIFIGLAAGWSIGSIGRALDSLISSALSIPVLFVALFVIAALASKWGVWAFILGLSITGWAEAARLVQEQTRSIKAQPFVESSRAMGAGAGQITLSHIIPHVLPLIWIQLAFEVSAALLTAAALGFLGYFINAVWIPIQDFTGLRASGTPELGQMLGVSVRSQPWTAMFAGGMIFVIVLAFNLLGEGLRFAFNPDRHRKMDREVGFNGAASWIEERVYLAVTEWRRTAATGGAFTALFLVILGGGWFLWKSENSGMAVTQIQVPGDHPWASELHDAQGTLWSAYRIPQRAGLLWSYTATGELLSGPVVDRAGNLYLNSEGGRVISLNAQGAPRGFVSLPDDLVGWPALTPEGNIVVADLAGNLFAFDAGGALLWKYASDPPDPGLSSPIIGPGGTIYYAVQNFLVAVTPGGQRLWQIRLPTYSFTSPLPRLSPDGQYLFFEDFVIEADTGVSPFRATSPPMDRYLVGADGKVYFRDQQSIMEWQTTEKGAVLISRARFNMHVLIGSQRFPFDAGVSPSNNPWLLYSSGFEYNRMVWTDSKGSSPQITDFPYRLGILVGIDADGVGVMCGKLDNQPKIECRAVNLQSGTVVWKILLDTVGMPVGGALLDGRVYVASSEGIVFALGH